jgi:hypothetical protein
MIYLYAAACIFTGLWEHRVVMTLSLVSALLSGKLVILEYSARASTTSEWAFRHSLWHVYITSLTWLAHVLLSPTHRTSAWPWMDGAPLNRISFLTLAALVEIAAQNVMTLVLLCIPPGSDPWSRFINDSERIPSLPWLSKAYRDTLVVLMIASAATAYLSSLPPFAQFDPAAFARAMRVRGTV